MTNTLSKSATPSPAQLRAELERMVIHELLGPAHGEHEELDERSVRDRYILGRLAPRDHTVSPEEQDDLEIGGDDSEDGLAERTAPATATMLPSAMGLTFAVEGAAAALKVTARWGRYERAESTHRETKSGQPAKVWQRAPLGGSVELPLAEGPVKPTPLDEEYPDVYVQGLIRYHQGPTPDDSAYTVSLFLVNNQPEGKPKDSAWLFQPELIIEAPDGAAIFRRRPFAAGQIEWEQEDLALQMAYRRRIEFAVGHGVGVQAEVAANPHRARRLVTTVVPGYDVSQVTPPTPAELPALAGLVVDMKTLAETAAADFAAADSEGTLGGLVSLGETAQLGRHLPTALRAAHLCSSDPLCAEHEPSRQGRTLHAAACHACLFAPETSCERGNKYLDRSLLTATVTQAALSFFE